MAVDPHVLYADSAPWYDRGPDVTVPEERIEVRITARFKDGYVGDVRGWASAWTPRAVDCFFPHPDPAVRSQGRMYRVWVPVADVSRDLGQLARQPASSDDSKPTTAEDDEQGEQAWDAP